MLTPNEKIVNVKIKRGELIRLMMACTSLGQGENREGWKVLHDKLKKILDDFDAKNLTE